MADYPALQVLDGEARGLAVGGPCDGAHLIAATWWSGQVRDRKRSHGQSVVHHPGRYVWYAGTATWNWEVPDVLAGSEAA